jgi:glycosyltransferase involved in cell wall biosynthesis
LDGGQERIWGELKDYNVTCLLLPKIAVVIPCHNAEIWIDRTIQSVFDQAYANLRVIVVDDGSSDGSIDRLRIYGDRLLLQCGPNKGACHARNEGLRLARDEGATYVLFLDADDFLEGPMLAGAAQVAATESADIVLSNMHLLYPGNRREERFVYSGQFQIAPETFFEGWMRGNYFNPSAILWRLEFIDQVGGWDESLSRAQDLDITLRAMFHGPRIYKNEEGAAIHTRLNSASISNNISRQATESRLRAMLGLLRRAPGTTFEPIMPMMMPEIYSISRTAFRAGDIDLGRLGLSEIRSRGYRAHPGTPAHRFLAGLIGLEAKVRFWGR